MGIAGVEGVVTGAEGRVEGAEPVVGTEPGAVVVPAGDEPTGSLPSVAGRIGSVFVGVVDLWLPDVCPVDCGKASSRYLPS